jgi:hypothetical protein
MVAAGELDELRIRATTYREPEAADGLVRALLADGQLDEALQFMHSDAIRAMRFAPAEQHTRAIGRVAKALVARGAWRDRRAARALLQWHGGRTEWRHAPDVAGVLAATGLLPSVLAILQRKAIAGEPERVADVVAVQVAAGDHDAAVAYLRARAAAGDDTADELLADVLAGCGRRDEAAAILRARALVGHRGAARKLRELEDMPATDAPESVRVERLQPVQVGLARWTVLAVAVVPGLLALWLASVAVLTGRLPVEVLSVPAGVALLALGVRYARRRVEATSWQAYGPGLLMLFVPTLVAVLSGGDAPLRRILLVAAAAVTVLAGRIRRQRAPVAVAAAAGVVALVREFATLSTPPLAVGVAIAFAALLLALYQVAVMHRRRQQRQARQRIQHLR